MDFGGSVQWEGKVKYVKGGLLREGCALGLSEMLLFKGVRLPG